ncbi:MAG: PEP-CTERM sorting domain-containing protein [Acidobacteriota bacterium]
MTSKRAATLHLPILSALLGAALLSAPGNATPFHFDAGAPDAKMAAASQPSTAGTETETGDDFILTVPTTLDHATFTGLIPAAVSTSSVQQVVIEIYRVFPKDSTNPPGGNVPTRLNSPSDVAFASRDSAVVGELSFSASLLSGSFTANNSVVNGIHPIPNSTTGGEGPVTGQEVLIDVSFSPMSLPADHYFFVPQVKLASGSFLWLSSPKPITGTGTTPFTPDLQSWIRDANLAPDWLRIGTDIVGGTTPPTFNQAFSLDGTITPAFDPTIPTLSAAGLVVLLVLLVGAAWALLRRRGERAA